MYFNRKIHIIADRKKADRQQIYLWINNLRR